jgi:host factor-I protein
MPNQPNLQDTFLNKAKSTRTPLTVFLVNGFQMRGLVTGFDNFTVILDSDGKQQLIYKHAISTIAPLRNVDLSSAFADTATETNTES